MCVSFIMYVCMYVCWSGYHHPFLYIVFQHEHASPCTCAVAWFKQKTCTEKGGAGGREGGGGSGGVSGVQ